MLHMVHGVVPIEVGNKVDPAGGPGQLIGYLMERYKPKATFYTPAKREYWWVIDFEDEAAMTELMLVMSMRFGHYPDILPCITGEQFPDVVGKAVPAANNAPEIG